MNIVSAAAMRDAHFVLHVDTEFEEARSWLSAPGERLPQAVGSGPAFD
jgi:hypothetical protein